MGEGNREKILSVKDVARLKCCSPESILNDIQKKNLKATFFHDSWHIRERDCKSYLEQEAQDHISITSASMKAGVSELIIKRAIKTGKIKPVENTRGQKIYYSSFLDWQKECFFKIPKR